ncbi:hypothetical protein B0J11DRAFT_597003 [Dendryphion nanum]|uniref:Uncharacterized protein n=1 Tax=Dendryphion nanum TaxID=256645 RepID=A0A9P9EEQ1_9PLEO|nr:hypothetical protein B0J11DRAFT_597003 [Dendryphion nanum]
MFDEKGTIIRLRPRDPQSSCFDHLGAPIASGMNRLAHLQVRAPFVDPGLLASSSGYSYFEFDASEHFTTPGIQPPPILGKIDQKILPLDVAVAEYNSVPVGNEPWRRCPTPLMDFILHPEKHSNEPDWTEILMYFTDPKTSHGLHNLQDFLIFLLRIVLPNAIVENRVLLLGMYTNRSSLPATCRLRYDHWVPTVGIADINTKYNRVPQKFNPETQIKAHARPIFRSVLTPIPEAFIHWLRRPIHLLPALPPQMQHRPSFQDEFLLTSEVEIRCLSWRRLLQGSIYALRWFWWITRQTKKLKAYKQREWNGVEREFK